MQYFSVIGILNIKSKVSNRLTVVADHIPSRPVLRCRVATKYLINKCCTNAIIAEQRFCRYPALKRRVLLRTTVRIHLKLR